MNEKIQAILLKIILELKKLGWLAAPDWEITLHSEKKIPLVRSIPVEGSMNNEMWNDVIEITLELELKSDDNITYIPNLFIYGQIFIDGGTSEDIAYTMPLSVALTEDDFEDERKIKDAASKINKFVEEYSQGEYTDYIDANQQNIDYYNKGGQRRDNDSDED
jgi:hypothetical protein